MTKKKKISVMLCDLLPKIINLLNREVEKCASFNDEAWLGELTFQTDFTSKLGDINSEVQ